jgi:hypothetical protein
MKKKIWKDETGEYHPYLIDKIKQELPDCVIIKNDPNYIQGIQDFTILNGHNWATLEAKISEKARNKPQPNQEYYVEKHNKMSYSSFIYPEVEDKVLSELYSHLKK